MADRTQMEKEIGLLETRLAVAKAARPAHDKSGAYQGALLEIEDELTEKRRALAALGTGESSQ